MWTTRRLTVREWLREQAAHLAGLYEGAVLIYCEQDYPARVHFVAHAVREIYNRLPEAISGEIARSKKDQGNDLVRNLIGAWDAAGLPLQLQSDGSSPASEASSGIDLPAKLHAALVAVVLDQRRSSDSAHERAGKMFAALGYTPIPPYVLMGWTNLGGLGHQLAHARAYPFADAETEKLNSYFDAFETQLHTIAQQTYENMDDLDEILDNANS